MFIKRGDTNPIVIIDLENADMIEKDTKKSFNKLVKKTKSTQPSKSVFDEDKLGS